MDDPEIQIVPYFWKMSFFGFGFGCKPAARIESLVEDRGYPGSAKGCNFRGASKKSQSAWWAGRQHQPTAAIAGFVTAKEATCVAEP